MDLPPGLVPDAVVPPASAIEAGNTNNAAAQMATSRHVISAVIGVSALPSNYLINFKKVGHVPCQARRSQLRQAKRLSRTG